MLTLVLLINQPYSGKKLFEELSQAADTFRPTMMIPGKDSGTEGKLRVMQICHKLDNEAKYAQKVVLNYDNREYHIKMRFFLLFDGQLIEMASGLGGAQCTMCPATKEQLHDIEFIKKGAKITHNITKLNDLYYRLEKNEDGTIKKTPGDYSIRMGMTQKPLFQFLDPTDTWPVTHFWIKILNVLENVLAHVYCREIFPNNTPTMRGQRKGPTINDAVKRAKEDIKDLQKQSLKMLVGQADPHGSGGTTGAPLLSLTSDYP